MKVEERVEVVVADGSYFKAFDCLEYGVIILLQAGDKQAVRVIKWNRVPGFSVWQLGFSHCHLPT